MAGDEQAQIDELIVAQEEDVVGVAIREALRSLNKSTPAIVEMFYPDKQTVDVRPAIKCKFVGGDPIDLPLCVDVPVVFPGAGNHVLTSPITKGDECLLLFCDRAIDNWFANGGTQVPSELRFHDLSDGMAIFGLSSTPRMMSPPISTTATELRTRDGQFVLRFEDTLLSLGTKNVQPAVVGTDLKDTILDAICDFLAKLTVPTGMGPSGIPINVADINAVRAKLGEILSSSVVVQKTP